MRKKDLPLRKQRRRSAVQWKVTAQLISALVFATWIVQPLFNLYSKFQASSIFLRLYRPVCVKPDWKILKTGFLASQLNLYCLFVFHEMPT